MLKVLEGIFGMHLKRFSILILTAVFACGASLNAPAIAASQDKEKSPKTSKVVVKNTKTTKNTKSNKQQKAVRVTVTRSSEPVPSHPSFATALMAWFIFGEPFTLMMALGLGLTMTGVVLVNTRQANTVATIAE